MRNAAGHNGVKGWRRVILCAVTIAFSASMLAVTAGGSMAQAGELEIKRGKVIWNNKSNCNKCHGWAGDGKGHPRSPSGPSLRISELDRETMHEVIACGVPGTNMPHHDRNAYTDGRCWGLTKDDLDKEMMPKMGNKPIRAAEIEMVIDYIEARMKGRGKVTLEECEEYFNKVGAKGCANLPKLADLND